MAVVLIVVRFQKESFNNLIKTVDDYENKTAARADVEKAISQLRTAHAEETVNPSQVSRGVHLKWLKTA